MQASLQRTNVRLTGNIKVVVSDDNIVMDSIDSNSNLNRLRYKGIRYNTDFTYAQNLRNFARNFTDKKLFYSVASESDIQTSRNLANQYHTLYDYGCYSATDGQSMFRFFAPVLLSNNQSPDAFVIYRLPPTVSTDIQSAISSGTLVKTFDLNTLFNSIKLNYSESALRFRSDIGFDVNGYDIESGAFERKSEGRIESLLANERTITEYENYFTNAFQRNNLVYSNIVNLEFRFDDSITNQFQRYVGFYVKYNDISKTGIDTITEPCIKLLKTETGIQAYDTDRSLLTYRQDVQSSSAISIGSLIAPQIEVNVPFNPRIGDVFSLTYKNVVQMSFAIDSSIINNDRSQTIQNIVNKINELSTTTTTISVSAFVNSTVSFIVRSNANDRAFENIQVSLPPNFQVPSVLYTTETDNIHQFYGGTTNSLILSNYFNPTAGNIIRLKKLDNTFSYHTITKVVNYAGQYIYKLDTTPTNISTTVQSVWLMKSIQEQPTICSLFDHDTLDFDRKRTVYDSILDFDPALYKEELESVVNATTYVGDISNFTKLDDETDADHLDRYKSTVLDQLNKYFNNITLNSNYLIKDIDSITLEATTVTNEYDRLSETKLTELKDLNNLYGFVSKWIRSNSLDVYGNNYRLNMSLPFRYDNFSPSIVSVDRDLRYHTHGWLIIGEGQPTYLTLNESNVKKFLSYSTEQITYDKLISSTIDPATYFRYTTDIKSYNGYSTLSYVRETDTCQTFFRGLLLDFPDITLNDYKFVTVLVTRNRTINNKTQYRFIRNDVFKILTLFIEFYIPDPILTTAEGGKDYYLDRSLLYFSDEIFTTNTVSVDLGVEQISLDLYNNTSNKTYLGASVGTLWFNNETNDRRIFVGRGLVERFDGRFTDILELGDTFEVFNSSTDQTDTGFGFVYRFINILEVGEHHFWCENFELDYVVVDLNNETDPDDDVVETTHTINVLDVYLADNNVLFNNPYVYISKAIAENAINYRRSIRTKANVARYKDISTASIAELLKSKPLDTVRINIDDSILNTKQKCTIVDAPNIESIIRLTESNNTLTTLDNMYSYIMKRYDGSFEPMRYNVHVPQDLAVSEQTFNKARISTIQNDFRYRLNVSIIENIDNTLPVTERYTDSYSKSLLDTNFYSILSSSVNKNNNYINTVWLASPNEHRSFVSLAMNSDIELTVSATTDSNGSIDFTNAFDSLARLYIPFDLFSLTDTEKLNILKLYVDVDAETLPNFNFDTYIINEFNKNVLLQIYEITEIRSSNNRINFSYTDSNALTDRSNATVTMTLKRKTK